MTSPRAYNKGKIHTEAVNEITRCSGTQFGPNCVKAFARVMKRFSNIRKNVTFGH